MVPTSVTLLLIKARRQKSWQRNVYSFFEILIHGNKKVKAEIIKLPHDKRFYTMI